MLTVVQISFKLTLSGKEYEKAMASLAQTIADVVGLQWKIWLLNEANHEAGGIYLFKDQDAAKAFVEGPLVTQVRNAPSVTDFCVAQFGVLSTLTEITRGPITNKPPDKGPGAPNKSKGFWLVRQEKKSEATQPAY